MADSYGLIALEGPFDGPAGDRALGALGEFMAAVLRSALGAFWSQFATGAVDIVSRVEFNDPGEWFSAKNLPALHVWCSQIRDSLEDTSDDLDSRIRTITWQWFFEPATLRKHSRITPAFSVIDAAIRAALRRGRSPAWIAAGDDAESSQLYGTPLLTWAGIRKIKSGNSRIDIERIAFGGRESEFAIITGQLEFTEDVSTSSSDYGPMAIHQDYTLEDDSVLMTDPDEYP